MQAVIRVREGYHVVFKNLLESRFFLFKYDIRGWKEVSDKGGLTPDFHTVCDENELYDYVRLEDIDRLNKAAGLERVKIISADGAADYMRRELNEMSEEEFQAFCKYQLAIAERPELVGAGSHTVDILKNN